MKAVVRRATPDEAPALSELALRSKALWGYDPAFLEACRAPLTLAPTYIATQPVYVLENHGRTMGFYGLSGAAPRLTLEFLYVEPRATGLGMGRQLFAHALTTARSAGAHELLIAADPFAEGFYRAMGATRIGQVPSEAIPDRWLPLMRLELARTR
jgi:GNAT superfamily N-acetyltransferase